MVEKTKEKRIIHIPMIVHRNRFQEKHKKLFFVCSIPKENLRSKDQVIEKFKFDP